MSELPPEVVAQFRREAKARAMKRAFKGVVPVPARRALFRVRAALYARHEAAVAAQNALQPFDPADLLPVYRHPLLRRVQREARKQGLDSSPEAALAAIHHASQENT